MIALGRLGGSGGIGSSISHSLRAPLYICNREELRSTAVLDRLNGGDCLSFGGLRESPKCHREFCEKKDSGLRDSGAGLSALKASCAWNELGLHESRGPCFSGRSERTLRGDSGLNESRDARFSGKRETLEGGESDFHESDVS